MLKNVELPEKHIIITYHYCNFLWFWRALDSLSKFINSYINICAASPPWGNSALAVHPVRTGEWCGSLPGAVIWPLFCDGVPGEIPIFSTILNLSPTIPLHILTSMFSLIGCEVVGLIYSDFGSERSIVKSRWSTHQKKNYESPLCPLSYLYFDMLCMH